MNRTQRLEAVLRHYDAVEARRLADTVESIYRKSYAEAIESGRVFNTVDAFMNRFQRYSALPDLAYVVAYHYEEPIGQTWGWPLHQNSSWWDGLESEPEENFTVENGRRTFALSEIMVVQDWVGHGVAHALHDALLSKREEQRATLLVRPENPARNVYQRWGWSKAGRLRPNWEGAPTFDVLMRRLNAS